MTVTDACLEGLAARIAATYGVDFSGFRRASLADAVRARVGESPQGCAGLITAGPEALLPVVEAALNGETYFLRHGGHFDALRREVLPRLYAARRATRRLRVWSAGCSSGEEALSLAMVLLETAPGPDWDLQVLGTDLSREALRRAEQATYGEWSFRGVPDGIRARYFTRSGTGWRPSSRLRAMVRYLGHNLLDGPPDHFDVVVCRNVLIYFQDAHLARAARTLVEGVSQGGWLLTGPAEARAELFDGLQAVHLDDALLFCRADAGFVAPQPTPVPAPPRSRFARVTAPVSPPRAQPSGKRTARMQLDVSLRRIRRLADRGETDAAWNRVEEAAKTFSLFPEVHLVRALLARARGQATEALRSATAALFLDPGLALASVIAGDVLRAAGNPDGAARAYRNALTALGSEDQDNPVAHGDGITAGELTRLARRSLALVDRAEGGTAA